MFLAAGYLPKKFQWFVSNCLLFLLETILFGPHTIRKVKSLNRTMAVFPTFDKEMKRN